MLAYLALSTILDGSPRTLRFQIDDWQNQSWGLHNIDRRRIQCEVAIAGDGSRMNLCEHESFRHYLVPNGRGTIHTLYLRADNAAFEIDDAARSVRGGKCDCGWEPVRAFADDHECSRTAEARLWEGKRIGTGKIAGHSVVRYQSVDDEGVETELSLAPGLACEVMEEVRTWPGTFGIPGAKWHFLVTDYKPGEPERSIFRPPLDYHVAPR
jgi:hypothetical protein